MLAGLKKGLLHQVGRVRPRLQMWGYLRAHQQPKLGTIAFEKSAQAFLLPSAGFSQELLGLWRNRDFHRNRCFLKMAAISWRYFDPL
jgi:hypothetical protein